MNKKITWTLTVPQARIVREMLFDRIFQLSTLPANERTETNSQMAAAERALRNLEEEMSRRGVTQ